MWESDTVLLLPHFTEERRAQHAASCEHSFEALQGSCAHLANKRDWEQSLQNAIHLQ